MFKTGGKNQVTGSHLWYLVNQNQQTERELQKLGGETVGWADESINACHSEQWSCANIQMSVIWLSSGLSTQDSTGCSCGVPITLCSNKKYFEIVTGCERKVFLSSSSFGSSANITILRADRKHWLCSFSVFSQFVKVLIPHSTKGALDCNILELTGAVEHRIHRHHVHCSNTSWEIKVFPLTRRGASHVEPEWRTRSAIRKFWH